MKVVFCIPGFDGKKLRLQPWLTVSQVAERLAIRGHEVHVVTDCASEIVFKKIAVHSVGVLRGTNSASVCRLLQHINPESVVTSITPLSLLTSGWYRELRRLRSFAYVSYPFYSDRQLFRALPHLAWRERWQYGRQALVPRCLWTSRLIQSFQGVVCQSSSTGQTFQKATGSKVPVHVIPPGADKRFWVAGELVKSDARELVCLYVGTASKIRGFFVALDAFAMVKDPGVRLRVLARGADMQSLDELSAAAAQRGIADRVTIRGGWLDAEDLKGEIQSASLVLFPFVLVPSELPVSVLEAVCAGTPVVVSDIDGLAEAAGPAGIVAPQASPAGLAEAIQSLRINKDRLVSLRMACKKHREQILDWDACAARWESVLSE